MNVRAPLVYCALRYLLQWLRDEKGLHGELRQRPTPEAIRRALAHFGVARGFAGLSRQDGAQRVLKALLEAETRAALPAVERVTELARILGRPYGVFALSAASKLLWLRHRAPYIIYDRRACQALMVYGAGFDARDYGQYVRVWRQVYVQYENAVKKACAALPALPGVAESVGLSPHGLRRLCGQRWFEERVFDIYLWELGADGRRSARRQVR